MKTFLIGNLNYATLPNPCISVSGVFLLAVLSTADETRWWILGTNIAHNRSLKQSLRMAYGIVTHSIVELTFQTGGSWLGFRNKVIPTVYKKCWNQANWRTNWSDKKILILLQMKVIKSEPKIYQFDFLLAPLIALFYYWFCLYYINLSSPQANKKYKR